MHMQIHKYMYPPAHKQMVFLNSFSYLSYIFHIHFFRAITIKHFSIIIRLLSLHQQILYYLGLVWDRCILLGVITLT